MRELAAPSWRRLLGPLRSRLALRIYLIGLVQFFVVAVGIVVVARQDRPTEPSMENLRVVAESIAAASSDPRAMQ